MSRYIERAESIARLVEVNSQFLLDAKLDRRIGGDEAFWQPVLESTALTDLYAEIQAKQSAYSIPWFLALSTDNPDSIRNCITSARENARMVRDQISDEMWIELNTLHLFLQSAAGATLWRTRQEEFCERIVRFSLLFQGITDSTVPRNEGWHFINLGKFLERAEKTSRIMDIPGRFADASPGLSWAAVLGACSARAAFREQYHADANEYQVMALLLFGDSFPRSIRFSIRQVNAALHAISGTPYGQYSNEPERLAGAALASLDYASPDDVASEGLPCYVDKLQQRFNELGQSIFETYVLLPYETETLSMNTRMIHSYQQSLSALQLYQQQQQQQ